MTGLGETRQYHIEVWQDGAPSYLPSSQGCYALDIDANGHVVGVCTGGWYLWRNGVPESLSAGAPYPDGAYDDLASVIVERVGR